MGTIVRLHKPDLSEELIQEPTTVALWVELVRIGEERTAQQLGVDLESYLVFTLLRFMQRTELFSTTIGSEYLNASTQYTGSKKEEAFHTVGDVSLILAGLYPERHKSLNVSSDYFSKVGRMAFFDLADHFRQKKYPGKANLYKNVGEGFLPMVKVLTATREDKSIKKRGFLNRALYE